MPQKTIRCSGKEPYANSSGRSSSSNAVSSLWCVRTVATMIRTIGDRRTLRNAAKWLEAGTTTAIGTLFGTLGRFLPSFGFVDLQVDYEMLHIARAIPTPSSRDYFV